MINGQTVLPSDIGTRVISKCKWRLLPYLFIFYAVALLDRANIGFAALTMNKDLGVDPHAFGLIGGIFYIGYVLFEVPSNMALHRYGARKWIARILISWGIVGAATGFVNGVNQLMIVRFLLGVAEAGFYPGILLYCTYWFRREERAQAITIFMMAQPVFAMVGGPVSGWILDNIHWLGVASWRWMLVLEALPAVIMGIACYYVLPDRPESAKFLTEDEKQWLMEAMRQESEMAIAETGHACGWKVFRNLKVWYLAIAAMIFTNATIYMNFWLPSLIKELAKGAITNTNIGFWVAIPMLCGLIFINISARHSDRTQERKFHVAIPMLIAGVALSVLSYTRGQLGFGLSLFLLVLFVAAVCNFYAVFWSLPSRFLTGYAAASGLALISTVANLTGFVGPAVIGQINKSTGSLYTGVGVIAACMLVASAMLMLYRDKAKESMETVDVTAGSVSTATPGDVL